MEFTLIYEGKLKGNGNKKHKMEIRRKFHPQIQHLWKFPPLKTLNNKKLLLPPDKHHASIIKEVGGVQFVPLVNEKYSFLAELEIIMLRPHEPGSIVTRGGDIDNCLKTLFDSLQIPHDEQDLKKDMKNDESPFFCLLEDDKQISSVSVKSERLLQEKVPSDYVHLFIHVRTIQITESWVSY